MAVERAERVSLRSAAAAAERYQRVAVFGEDVDLIDVHMDSRAVTPGSLYVAISGSQADGHDFVDAAIERGAVALAVEDPSPTTLPYLVLEDTRAALGWMAAAVHRHPSHSLGTIGITGTNGKTTVAHMLAAIYSGPGRSAAVIGTVSANLGNVDASPRTTPEASDLHRILRSLLDDRVTDVAIEVSSHAMVMGRINGVEFNRVAFTNLSQDHLDYHGTMEEYFAAKASLFHPQWAPDGVVWVDDPWGRRLVAESGIPVTTVGTHPGADVEIRYGEDTPSGSSFTLGIGGEPIEVRNSVAGRFNVANAAIALTCAYLDGLDLEESTAKLAAMPGVPGRYNTVENDLGLWVVVDYAHTPDAIAGVVEQSRHLSDGKIIAVVGAGGDRDREKRPLMGAAAATADLAVITTDNPRSEDPALILEQVAAGVPQGSSSVIVPDRRSAIRLALDQAEAGDVVLILGKGHETTQEFADRVVPFDDCAVAREELSRMPGGPS